MKLIQGKPYLNLDSCFSSSEFESLIDSIILGIAKSQVDKVTFRSGGLTYEPDKQAIDVSEQLKRVLASPANPEAQFLLENQLKPSEQLMYMRYKYTTSHLNEGILLRSAAATGDGPSDDKNFALRLNHSFLNKGRAASTAETRAAENFRPFLDWVYSQKVFSEIGRVVLFLSDRGESSMRHKDHNLKKSPDEFVWINALKHLGKPKKFFVFDPDLNQKIYLENQFCYFDNSNFHGSEPSEYDTFSIRIDGQFSPEAKKRMGLDSIQSI